MLHLNLKGVELFIKKNQSEKTDSFWDNYDLVIWNKNSSGFYKKNGMYRKNSWGLSERFIVNSQGIWEMPIKYVKCFK